MTREEHIKWCKERAIAEINYSGPINGIISMASDLGKHVSTNNGTLKQLCMMQLISKPNITKQEAINFINGFN